MRGPLLPVLVLAVLPGLFFAWRLGLLRRRPARICAVALAVAVLLWSLPGDGVDFVYLKRANVFLAAAAIVAVVLRHSTGALALDARRYVAVLATLAAAALTVYLNFFSFHGARTWVHLHDAAHYYLGSKYFEELGYEHLYTAMLRAEAELTPGRFSTLEARDLSTNELVPIRELLLRSDEVKAAFTPERWQDWLQDVALFREQLGPQWKTLYADHGFNPTPLWPLLGGTLAQRVPAGSRAGVLALCLIDPVLLAAAFAAVVWAFGWPAALLGFIHFCLVFGASFGWTGGAFLRYLWFAALVGTVCALHRRRFGLAGALLALSAALRVFPAFFAVPLLFQGLLLAWRERRLPRDHVRFFAAMAATGTALLLATALQPRGLPAWDEFRQNTRKHMDTISPNIVGLTNALAYRPGGPELLTLEELREVRERRARVNTLQLATLFVAALVAAALLARRATPVEALLLGVPLLLTGLNLASYYYVFLVVMVVAWRDRPWRLVALFGLELASHALLLFEERETLLYIYRSVLLLYVLAALWLDPLREELRGLFSRPATADGQAERAAS